MGVMTHEALIRGTVFLAVLMVMALWETFAGFRPQSVGRWQRWPHNLMVVVVGTLLLRLVFPLAAVGAAYLAADRGWGIFNSIAIPRWLAGLVCFVVLDAVIYFQHRAFHKVPWLWRLHRMHHTDLEFDVTTGLRFHPFEIMLSMLLKVAVVILLGAPAVAVLVFEVVLSATAMFNHSNVSLPGRLDRYLRWLVVTPDMHRVHHSVVRAETDSNFGFNLPWWDRLFATYRRQPAAGQRGMIIGINAFREPRCLRLDKLLVQPFVSPPPSHLNDQDV
ncbi:sterol desaturase family protein [Gilvimarinus agarilyticus]|uniref:sterol desaturase family protein n=1 Tax=unclassified Gilvimarinus TaxID=2642066 RepID=UPI001C081F3F|nr:MULTISPECIES: sterol desaturase family protein [unclassified Gilvimarinus]MBU2884791.1 sterol desaturase family protein [Gilvimarinus agarilyticus]MDO6569841.1 sterol desaturase family protein [Gilvimarinus sp. 2_MG-2023]MDO6746461.1 sterol desaturase family protein [Gilvimarinus sp. 1_MG-2023]